MASQQYDKTSLSYKQYNFACTVGHVINLRDCCSPDSTDFSLDEMGDIGTSFVNFYNTHEMGRRNTMWYSKVDGERLPNHRLVAAGTASHVHRRYEGSE